VENQFNDTQDVKPETALNQKNEIGLPLLALWFSVFPFLLNYLFSGVGSFSSFLLLFLVLSPIAGLITGVSSLKRGKRRIGLIGIVISIIAIIIPLAFVALILVFYIGVATGIISLM